LFPGSLDSAALHPGYARYIDGTTVLFYHKLNVGGFRSTYWTQLDFDAYGDLLPRRDLLRMGGSPYWLKRGDNWGRPGEWCLDNPNDSLNLGTQFRQLNCNNYDAQKFDIIKITDEPTYMLRSHWSGYCVDVSENKFVPKQPVIQWHCHGDTNQRWKLVTSGNMFRLQSVGNSNLCLTFPNDQDGAALNPCDTTNWWKWGT
jgi:hypothetical protein